MSIGRRILVKFAVVYLVITCLSYGLFLYYTEVNKRVDVTLNLPNIIKGIQSVDFLENLFKDNIVHIKNRFQDCYNIVLQTNSNNHLVDYGSAWQTQINFLARLREGLRQYNIPGVDVELMSFAAPKCNFSVNNPLEYRNRALIFIFIFNLIHAALILSFFELLRSKNKSN